MIRKTIIAGIGTLLTMNLYADFATDFQSAVKLYNEQNNVEAQQAFDKLAVLAPTPESKAKSMAYAALSLSRQKKYDEATGLAKKIQLKPVSISCQMSIMSENSRFKELLDAFKDEDINAWPDYCVYNGFYRRGVAYHRSGDLQSASKDLENAVENAGSDVSSMTLALNDLGDVYKSLKEEQKALATYRKSSAMTISSENNYLHFNAVLNTADILVRQGKYDEALVELKKINLGKAVAGYWKFKILKAYGNLYEIQGKKDEAILKYKEALSVGADPAIVSELNEKVKLMERK